MSINPSRAQDVWKDAGEHVQFTVLKFNHKDPEAERAAFEEFADRSQAIIRSLRIRDAKPETGSQLKVAIGISNTGWDYLFPDAPKPAELETFTTLQSDDYEMPGTEGDLFFHIRASTEAVVYEAQTQFNRVLEDATTVVDETKGFRYFEGRAIIGFIDGTEAPDIEDAADYALVGDEDPKFENGSYAFAQKWHHDMPVWNHLSTEDQEKAIGREKFSDYELADAEKFKNAHNVASKFEEDGEEQKIVRMNVPFSNPASGNTGTYFIGYSRRWSVTKGMLLNMITKGDYLLTFSKVLTGQVFFIPSRDLLADMAEGDFK